MRPGSEVLLTVAEHAEGARFVAIGVVTTRERADVLRNDFTLERSGVPNYAELAISIPSNHRTGEIEWPCGASIRERPSRSSSRLSSTSVSFFGRLRAADGPPTDIAIVVHGYNYNFPEALFRKAQLAADAQESGATIVLVWPSQGEVAAYGRITLFAHSMGGWLAMESERQLRLQRCDDVVDRLQVVLAAPDIDLDLFERQLSVVGPLDPPLTVLTSADDREQGIVVVEISQIASTDALNRGRFDALASMASEFEGSNDIRQSGASVFDTVGAAISSPFTLVGGALAGQ